MFDEAQRRQPVYAAAKPNAGSCSRKNWKCVRASETIFLSGDDFTEVDELHYRATEFIVPLLYEAMFAWLVCYLCYLGGKGSKGLLLNQNRKILSRWKKFNRRFDDNSMRNSFLPKTGQAISCTCCKRKIFSYT